MARLAELTLRHVDPTDLMFQLRHPAFPMGSRPAWFDEQTSGGITFAPWLRGTVLVRMHTKFEKPAFFVSVAVLGLYTDDDMESAQDEKFSGEVDSSTLDEATPDELRAFGQRASDDLYPFLRTELHNMTGRVQGLTPVMLQPWPKLQDNIRDK